MAEERPRLSSSVYLQYIVVLLVLLCAITSAKQWTKESYPNPTTDRLSCGRRGVMSWICDPDQVVSYEDANTLEQIVRNIATKTTSGCGHAEKPGYQIGVAVMKKMAGPDGQSAEDKAKEFAVYLHDVWGVGHAGCDDGALLLLSVEDRQVYISTGRAAMERLTAHQIDIIIDEMRPLLRSRDYAPALHLAADRMGEVLSGKNLSSGSLSGLILIILFFLVVIAIISYSVYKQNQFEKCQKKLKLIEQERSAAKENKKYESTSCPICLEEFTAGMATRLLLCGHKYCEPCLTKWLESNATCPICRQSTSSDKQPQSAETRDFMPELSFRLMSLRHQFPSFMTMEMIYHWTAGQYAGSFVSDPVFSQSRPVFSGGASGSYGSGSGFGGGGSSGGGGRGGSW